MMGYSMALPPLIADIVSRRIVVANLAQASELVRLAP
jgi:hypothetical protein